MRYARIAVVLGMMLLTGCGGPPIPAGEIYDKQWEPEHQIEVDDSFSIDVGGVPVTIPASHTETVPDRYFISFRKMNEAKKEWDNRTVEVHKSAYDSLQLGDFYDTGEKP